MARPRRRFLAGESLAAIGRATGLSRGTVRKYAHADEAPERRAYGPGASRLDPYISHLDARLRAGCENASALWREIVALGYTGTPKQVLRYVTQRRSIPSPQTPRKWLGHRDGSQRIKPVAAELPSPRAMAWAMTRPGEELAVDEAAALARVRQDAEARDVADLARRFTALIRAASPDHARSDDDYRDDAALALDRWVAEAQTCGATPIANFADGIARDIGAVHAAVTTLWSNGQAEGQINRLKMPKRQMYGRASFGLLRKRVLMGA